MAGEAGQRVGLDAEALEELVGGVALGLAAGLLLLAAAAEQREAELDLLSPERGPHPRAGRGYQRRHLLPALHTRGAEQHAENI